MGPPTTLHRFLLILLCSVNGTFVGGYCLSLPTEVSRLVVQTSRLPGTKALHSVVQPAARTTVAKPSSLGSTFLSAATDASDTRTNTENSVRDQLDVDAVGKYAAAIAVQMVLLSVFLSGLDALVKVSNLHLPFGATTTLFYALALRSRLFNPLANRRPSARTLEAGGTDAPKRVMPSWTPPGVVFPVVWLLVVGPLRAVSSAMVYQATQQLAHPAILALMLHLSIGDVWNTINNVERRYGAAVTGVAMVWASKAWAALQYYQVVPRAGQLLALPLVWLTIASALVAATWRLNPNSQTGRLDRLYPTVGQAKTKFEWFQSKS